jgi:hypothetical protein
LRRGFFGAQSAANARALFDAHARRGHVARHLSAALEKDRFAAADFTHDRAGDGDARSGDVAAHAGLIAERHVSGDLHVAIDAPVDLERAISAHVAAHDGALTNDGTFGHLVIS